MSRFITNEAVKINANKIELSANDGLNILSGNKNITINPDGTIIEEIESMDFCKWRINGICCNDKSEHLADYPYPSSICELEEDGQNHACDCFEKEDGII